jgi:hypothetical protein
MCSASGPLRSPSSWRPPLLPSTAPCNELGRRCVRGCVHIPSRRQPPHSGTVRWRRSHLGSSSHSRRGTSSRSSPSSPQTSRLRCRHTPSARGDARRSPAPGSSPSAARPA